MSARIEAIRKRRRDRAMLSELRNNPAWGPIVLAEPHKTLRDEFAAKAMQGLLAGHIAHHGHENFWPYPDMAGDAYSVADAMLKAREA